MKEHRMSLKEDAAVQAALATPPSGVVTLTLLGYNLNDLILLGTAVLIVLQIGFLLHKWVRMVRTKEGECSVKD
jgi:hypothetical protein